MDKYQSLNHTRWECLYHVVFIPKCRRHTLYVELRKYLTGVFRDLARQREGTVEEGHLIEGSRAHVAWDSAEVFSVERGRLHQGEDFHPHSAGLR